MIWQPIMIWIKTWHKTKVYKMLEENRIKYFTPADYTMGSELELLVQGIIKKTAANELLEQEHIRCLIEKRNVTSSQTREEQKKNELIDELGDSRSFMYTHEVVKKLSEYNEWTVEQKTKLISVALENTQVRYILRGTDIKEFYTVILEKVRSKRAREIREILKLD